MIAHYIELTKPRIMLLIVFSGLTALFVEGEFLKNNLLLSILSILILVYGIITLTKKLIQKETEIFR